MRETLTDALLGLPIPPPVVILLSAMLPVIEARYAIVLGWGLHLPLAEVLPMALLGNLLTTIPLLLLIGPASAWASRSPRGARIFAWVFARARRRQDLIDRYGVFGLTVFIAVPLPMTGAWTGAVMAFVFGVRFWPALLAVFLGVAASAALVSVGTYGGVAAFSALAH
jgi:uncharacterized membrane protein